MGTRKEVWDEFLAWEEGEVFANHAKLLYEVINSNLELEDSLFSEREGTAKEILFKLCDISISYTDGCPECSEGEEAELKRMFPSLSIDIPRCPYGAKIHGFYLEFFNHPAARKGMLELCPCPCLYESVEENLKTF